MLNKAQIKELINSNLLLEGFPNLDKQLTPNGIDLTLGALFTYTSAGKLDFSNSERLLPEVQELMPEKKNQEDKYGWWQLTPGAYKIRTNETVNLPNNLTALAFTRTSLLRMGAFTQHGVWDAGFCGKGEFMLSVQNPSGIEIKQNARVAQLVFFPVDETEQYKGIYKNLK